MLGGVENAMAVASRGLHFVHGLVGVANQLLRLSLRIIGGGDSDAAGYREIATFINLGDADRYDDPIGDEWDIFIIAQRCAQHDKLVATNAGNGVGVP